MVVIRLKAVVFTASATAWALVCVGAAAYDFSSLIESWHTIRIVIWLIEIPLVVGAICFWLFERPRQIKIVAEPPVIHSA